MPTKKESSTGDKRGISTPSTKHVEEKMEKGNPSPAAEPSKLASFRRLQAERRQRAGRRKGRR